MENKQFCYSKCKQICMHICGMCPKRYISGKNQGAQQCAEFDSYFGNKMILNFQEELMAWNFVIKPGEF